MKYIRFILLWLCSAALIASTADQTLYQNTFEQAEVGALPAGLLVLEGEFIIKQEGTNKFLELPGSPLDNFGVQLGPVIKEDATVSARIFGTAKGRRYPIFGVALGGVTGYRLQVSPSKKALEIYKDQDVKATVAYEWKPATWTMVRMKAAKVAEGWKIQGKAWPQGEPEPKDWLVSTVEKEPLATGRAAITGSPFSGTPIWFDDVVVERAGP